MPSLACFVVVVSSCFAAAGVAGDVHHESCAGYPLDVHRKVETGGVGSTGVVGAESNTRREIKG